MKKFEFSISIFSKSCQNFRLLFFRWQRRFFIKKIRFRSKKDDFDLEKSRFWKIYVFYFYWNPKSKTDHFWCSNDDFRLEMPDFGLKGSILIGKYIEFENSRLFTEFFGFSSSKFKCNSIETVIESDENLMIRKDSVAFEIIPIISEVIQCSKTKWS